MFDYIFKILLQISELRGGEGENHSIFSSALTFRKQEVNYKK